MGVGLSSLLIFSNSSPMNSLAPKEVVPSSKPNVEDSSNKEEQEKRIVEEEKGRPEGAALVVPHFPFHSRPGLL